MIPIQNQQQNLAQEFNANDILLAKANYEAAVQSLYSNDILTEACGRKMANEDLAAVIEGLKQEQATNNAAPSTATVTSGHTDDAVITQATTEADLVSVPAQAINLDAVRSGNSEIHDLFEQK